MNSTATSRREKAQRAKDAKTAEEQGQLNFSFLKKGSKAKKRKRGRKK